MSDFLTAVKTVSLRPKVQSDKAIVQEVLVENRPQEPVQQNESVTLPEEALTILHSHPDLDALKDVLKYLKSPSKIQRDFNIKIPTASSAKIINELIVTTIPDFWDIEEIRPLLLHTLRSVAGIGALLARLNLLIAQHGASKQHLQDAEATRPLTETIAVFSRLLTGDGLAVLVWEDINELVDNQTKRTLLWKEFLLSTASGKIVSAVAQAEDLVKTTRGANGGSWLSDGSSYSAWLGRNAAVMAQRAKGAGHEPIAKAAAQLLGKSFGIGYSARVIDDFHLNLTLSPTQSSSSLDAVTQQLQVHEQKQLLGLTMKFMTKRCTPLLNLGVEKQPLGTPPQIVAAAALIRGMINNNQSMKAHLVSWLSDPNLSSTEPFAIRRAAVSALAEEKLENHVIVEDHMQDIMEKNMKLFGDSLFIKHTPIVQQEACAQVLLLSAGYVHRAQPMFLFTLARSSIYLNATSKRLHSSSTRSRFLGMVVAMAISDLVDKSGSKMNFDVEDVKTPEAERYMQMAKLDDKVGSSEDMRNTFNPQKVSFSTSAHKSLPKDPKGGISTKSSQGRRQNSLPSTQTSIQGPRIVEVMDDSDEEDADLVTYAKPDSDPEDEDEDPTLVNRNKSKPPVYIRDLIAGLNDTENHDRHTLALKHAASLIRRKSSFGKEVSDHAIELASTLTGLGDNFETDNFQEIRLQALIAVLLSNPGHMAPWFASQVFEGDYSLSQRITVLSVLGLSARELAGYKDEDKEMNPALPSTSFPSKRLPDRLHKIYAAEKQKPALSRIASSLETAMIQPMALKAADSVSGPNILKVRTFSSRMEVEKKRKKAIPNLLAKVVAEGFFFPLTGRWWQNAQAYGSNNVHFQPFLLSMYLKTLAILLHASGPSALNLPQMTGELWDLLLGVRTNALGDVSVLEATLFSLLTLLEVNEDKRSIADEHAKRLVETQGWVELVFERSSGRDEESERIRMLAASVLMKTREVVEKYQRLLVGSMMDY